MDVYVKVKTFTYLCYFVCVILLGVSTKRAWPVTTALLTPQLKSMENFCM